MRRYCVLARFTVIALLLGACASSTDAPATPIATETLPSLPSLVGPTEDRQAITPIPNTPGAPVVISFAAPPEMQVVYQPLIAAFQNANPDIRVQLVDVETLIKPVVTEQGTFSTEAGSLREILSGADTADASPTPEAIAKGWVADLKPFMDADPTFEGTDFAPGALEAYTRDDHTYLAPGFVWLNLLSYNKDLWAKRGLPAPKPGWSWSDLKAAATQLAQKRGATVDVYGLLDWDGGYQALLAELAEAGVTIDPSAPARIDRPEIAAALERAAALVRSGAIYEPLDQPRDPQTYRSVIMAQQVGIWRSDMLDATANPGFAVGTVPYPGSSIGVSGYVMSSGTQHPQAAWRWLSFLSHQTIAWPTRGPGPLPARTSVARQSGYWERLDSETAAAFRAAIAQGSGSPPLEFDLRSFVFLRQAVLEVARGEKTTARALHDAQAALEQQLAQAPPEPTPANDSIVVAPPPPIAPPDATTIVFAAPGVGSDPIEHIAHSFNEQHTGVFVQVKHINLPGGSTHLAELAGQSDCFVGGGPPGVDERAALLDLQPLIDADPSFARDDIPRALLGPFQIADRLYGLPYAVDFRVLHYNQTAFDAAGIAYPNAAWILDDMIHVARSLTHGAGDAKQYGFASTFLQWRDVWFFLDRMGAVATTGAGATIHPNFTDPRVVQAVQSYLDLLRTASPHRWLSGYIQGEVVDSAAITAVHAGRVGMWFDFGAFVANTSQYHGFTHAIAPPPLGAGSFTADDFRATGLYISAHTQHTEACWTWLKALSSTIAGLQGAFPARISLAESDAFIAQAPPGALDVYRAYRRMFERAPDSASAPVLAAPSPIDWYWFFRGIDRALQGQNLERELNDAQALTERFLACVRGGTPGSRCAKKVDPGYKGWANAARDSQ